MSKENVAIVMPVLNEANNIGDAIDEINAAGYRNIYIGLDPQTSDNSEEIAEKKGATVVKSPESGFDMPLYSALTKALANPQIVYVVFCDAGKKQKYEKINDLYEKIEEGYDFVLGYRVDPNDTMHWHQKFGTQVVLFFINLTSRNMKVRDIAPLRIVSANLLRSLNLHPNRYRMTTEILVKALRKGARVAEVEVLSLARTGTSKIGGNFKKTFAIALDMLSGVFIR